MAFQLPVSISSGSKYLSVNRLKGNVNIPIENIKEIRLCNKSDTKNSTRLLGSGGFFGYLGKFKSPQLGNYKMYVTDTSKKILIKTDNEVYIISCKNPNEIVGFTKNIQSKIF